MQCLSDELLLPQQHPSLVLHAENAFAVGWVGLVSRNATVLRLALCCSMGVWSTRE